MGSSTNETDRGDMYEPPYNGDHYALTAQNSLAAAYGSSGVYSSSYPATSAPNSTGGFDYQSALSSTSSYGGYTGYDLASVTSSSVPSYGGYGSVSGWSDSQSRGTAASSMPSRPSHHYAVNNTIHRQAPISERYQLPCEFHNLTGCNRVFPGDDTQDWMDHIEGHLQSKFPTKLFCWFCNDQYFDAGQTSSGDARSNFIMRMKHIRDHIVYDGSRTEHAQKDGHLVQHLLDRGLIDRRTYDDIVHDRIVRHIPRIHNRRHHQRLPRVEEEVVATSSSMPRHQHVHERRNPHRRASSKTNDWTRGSDDAQSLASPSSGNPTKPLPTESNQISPTGKGRARDADYTQSLSFLSLNDCDPPAPPSDYYDTSYTSAYSSLYGAPSTGDDRSVTTAQSWNNSSYAKKDGPVIRSRTVPGGEKKSVAGSIDSVSRIFQLKAQESQYDHLNSDNTKHHSSEIAVRGFTKLRLHVASHRLASLLGLSCISTTWRGGTELSRGISKMGGAISITLAGKTSLYGVTSGHGFIHQLLDVAPQLVGGENSSMDSLSEISDSESEDGEESSSFSAESSCSGDRASTDSAVDLSDHTSWTPIDHEIKASFLGFGLCLKSERESHSNVSQAEDTLSGDLALFPIDSLHRPLSTNYYIEPASLEPKDVAFISENEVESTLPVVILLGPEQTVSGILQPGKCHFSMRGTMIDARQIRLSKDLPMGTSGSWVVHDQTLYGMIIAVVPGECTALMVPAKKMMSDIQTMFPGASHISVAVRY